MWANSTSASTQRPAQHGALGERTQRSVMATSTSASSADTTKGFSASRSINLSLGSFSRGRFKNSSSLAFVPNNSLCSISVQLQNNVGTDNATPATQTTTTKKRPHEHPQSISVEEASSRPAAMGTTEVPPPLKIRRPLTGVQPSTLSSSAPQSACSTPVNRSYPPATTTAHSAPFAPSVHRSPSSLPPPPSFHHASPSHHAPPASFSAPSSYLPSSYFPTPPSASSSQNTLSLPSSALSVPPSLSSPSASVPDCTPSNFSSSASLSSQTPSTPSGPTAYPSSFAPSLQPKPQLHIAGFRRGASPSSSSTSSSLAFFSSPSSPSCTPSLPSPIFMADPSSSSSLPPLHSSLSPASSVLKNDVPEHFRYVSPEDVPSSKMWYEEALRRQKEAELAAIAEMEALPDTRDEPSLEEECPDLQLTPSQKQVIDAAKSGESFFFTGCAGTGKSFLLREIVVQLRKLHLPGEVYVTASTGIAACNIGGCTLHAFAGVGLAKGKVERLARRVERDKLSAPRWRKAKVLVIDEISMLPGELFDKLEWIARAIRDDQRPFGGIQVILCGDFFQLPPVMARRLCFEADSWPRVVRKCYQLLDVFRQTDREFVTMLANIRLGKLTPQVLQQLTACVQRTRQGKSKEEAEARHQRHHNGAPSSTNALLRGGTQEEEGEQKESTKGPPTRLFATKNKVMEQNMACLQQLPGKSYIYDAVDEGKEPFLAKLQQSCPAPARLELRVGAQVILLKNLSFVGGLVNGARGVVTGFMQPPEEHDFYPIVRFGSSSSNAVERVIVPVEWPMDCGNKKVAARVQVPLNLAWAISIHKSQGMTLERVEMDLANVFQYGQAYVALSRVKTLEGLSLLGFEAKKIRAHPRVIAFYERCFGSSSASSAAASSSSTEWRENDERRRARRKASSPDPFGEEEEAEEEADDGEEGGWKEADSEEEEGDAANIGRAFYL